MARDTRRKDGTDDKSGASVDGDAAVPATSEAPPATEMDKKIATVMASAMPDSEKERYVRELRGRVADPNDANRMPFDVYANIKGIKHSVRVGMLAYPKANGVKAATVPEWDEIFTGF